MKNMWSEFRVLAFVAVVAAVLVFAGCSSPTGSDAGAGTGTIEIRGGAGATNLDGIYSVDRIVLAGIAPDLKDRTARFCISHPDFPDINAVEWLKPNSTISVGGQTNGYTPVDGDPESSVKVDGEWGTIDNNQMTKNGTFKTTGLRKNPNGPDNLEMTFTFQITGVLVEYQIDGGMPLRQCGIPPM